MRLNVLERFLFVEEGVSAMVIVSVVVEIDGEIWLCLAKTRHVRTGGRNFGLGSNQVEKSETKSERRRRDTRPQSSKISSSPESEPKPGNVSLGQ